MRILQLTDSLESGGAERMAVNFANAFARQGEFSALVVTRKEGDLKQSLLQEVRYLFLHRTKVLDYKALFSLKRFVKENQIEVVQAHGTSFFFACLLKLLFPKVKLYWHDHNGNRAKLSSKANRLVILMSRLFDGVFCVNEELKDWALHNLKTKNVHYLPNFTLNHEKGTGATILKGEADKRIVCLANLREPKNHHRLVSAFYDSGIYKDGWTLHLVGRDLNDDYSKTLKEAVANWNLNSSVYIYGSKPDIYAILCQAAIGMLVSTHEGFPVTLLEYGLSGLPVIASDVGYNTILLGEERGILVNPNEETSISEGILKLTTSRALQQHYAESFNQYVSLHFSEEAITDQLKRILTNDGR
ncbi:glycosyltransferase [Flavobacterium suncheonense]|uniref:glycosyltransferase n=1 Tax=Flavobacterium suncheonense TaxID=350894 RepID=UPI003FA3826B